MKHRFSVYLSLILASVAGNGTAFANEAPKPATADTKAINAAVFSLLDFKDTTDLADTQRGLMAPLASNQVSDANGKVVWNLDQYAFLNTDAPDTVNPALWRQAQLNLAAGLFQVTDHIYQIRGLDLSVVTFIEGDTGYIVIDPLVSQETAQEALKLMRQQRGDKKVKAVIYTHSHVDHYGGVKGVVTQAEVDAGQVKIIAPQGFMEEAVSENVMAGNAMSRRATYMYGSLLPRNARGQVDAGLGKGTSTGTVTLIAPTDTISKTGTTMVIDGIEIVFQVTPGSEAPAEMNFYFPKFRVLDMAENCTHTLHNLYTLRGAQVRDAKAWSHYIDESLRLFADKSDVVMASHHWPRWGTSNVKDFLKKQRDMYRYIHDQTLRLANQGYTMNEIAEQLRLPDALSKEWYNRGFYGTVSHDAKAVYQRYLGWFDGNPANLNPLPPVESGKKYVEFMGGASAVLGKARESFNRGEYRWVAQVVNHVVFAEPNNAEALQLQADALEQMGYQAESAPWRNFYLTGAKELRDGVIRGGDGTSGGDSVRAMPTDQIFDYIGLMLDGPAASGRLITLNFQFTDVNEKYLLTLENSVLNSASAQQAAMADATIITTRSNLNNLILGQISIDDAVKSGTIQVTGSVGKVVELLGLLTPFDPWFNIVTP
ncbi:MAG: alkyl sulfatase dimerization domain-containing protein [Pseudomonadota bacterium]